MEWNEIDESDEDVRALFEAAIAGRGLSEARLQELFRQMEGGRPTFEQDSLSLAEYPADEDSSRETSENTPPGDQFAGSESVEGRRRHPRR